MMMVLLLAAAEGPDRVAVRLIIIYGGRDRWHKYVVELGSHKRSAIKLFHVGQQQRQRPKLMNTFSPIYSLIVSILFFIRQVDFYLHKIGVRR